MRIACPPHLALQRLQAFLGALTLSIPGAVAEVAHLRTAEQVRRLRLGELDLGLVDDVVDTADVRTELVFDGEPLAAVLPFNHSLAAKRTLRARELTHETLLLFPRSVDPALHDWFTAHTTTNGYGFRDARETGDADPRDVLLAVAEGRGVTLAPRSALANAGAVSTLLAGRELDPPQRSPGIALAWARIPPPYLDRTIAAARDVARRMRRGDGPDLP